MDGKEIRVKEQQFEYSYDSEIAKEVRDIQKKYIMEDKNALDRMRLIDRKIENRARIVSVISGMMGTLVLGAGMSLILVWGGIGFAIGIIVGLVGICIISAAYPIYRKTVTTLRKEHSEEINALAKKILR